MAFQPLLAPNDDPQKNPKFFELLQYPLLASPKLDGIRTLPSSRGVLSRTLKLLPSLQLQEDFSHPALHGLDGETLVGNPTDFDVYNRTQSHVMSADKPGDIHFHVFDMADPSFATTPFYKRLEFAEGRVKASGLSNVHLVPHIEVANYDELIAFEEGVLQSGYEGIMMRSPVGVYKHGRSTLREGILIKLKRFEDAEGFIVGFVERMQNTNEKLRDERGYAKRSQCSEGLVPAGTLGKFLVSYQGDTLEISTGSFSHKDLQWIWDNQSAVLGAILKFRFFNHGVKDKPRFPRAIGFRSPIDM